MQREEFLQRLKGSEKVISNVEKFVESMDKELTDYFQSSRTTKL